MSLAIVQSRAIFGIDASPVMIEVHLSKGLPGFHIVGMPETAVRESRDRVRSAIINSELQFPTAKIIVNLAPADLPKNSSRFDLPIAIGILAASSQIPKDNLNNYEFAGELALTGEVRSIKGALPFALATQKQGNKLVLPAANVASAAIINNIQLYPANHLIDIYSHLLGVQKISPYLHNLLRQLPNRYPDFADVVGQQYAKRSMEISAAGGHSLLFIGPPGVGKTMLASRLPGILPPLREQESLAVAAIYSLTHAGFSNEQWGLRPFRSPHHTASAVALIGGGSPPRPGEVSLAHCGILFLDELPEFHRHVLEGLREPLESGLVSIARASYQVQFPAKVQLIAAMNPCPCGYYGDQVRACHCTSEQIQRYQQRISGPMLDRLDMHVEVNAVKQEQLFFSNDDRVEKSVDILHRVQMARSFAFQRANKVNADLTNAEVKKFCQIAKKDIALFQNIVSQLGLSARAYYRILKLARTIADLNKRESIKTEDWQEAIGYRKLTRILRH